MNREIEIVTTVSLEYDVDSPEFKEALESYREVIYGMGDHNDLLNHVAYAVAKYGTDKMIEGVGYVANNYGTPEDDYCGIKVKRIDIN